MTEPQTPPEPPPPGPPPGAGPTRRSLLSGFLGMTRALVLTAMALLTALAVLLMLLIRDVPSIETIATDLVTPIARTAGFGADAEQVAGQVVAEVDETVLGNAIQIADSLRVGIRFLPALPGLVILVTWMMTPGGWRRRKAIGGTAAGFGLFLFLYTWGLERLAQFGIDRVPTQAASVGEGYVDRLLGPAWTVAWVSLIAGAALWAYARFRLAASGDG